jgi:tetratricopeptide (TPR) repeat protein
MKLLHLALLGVLLLTPLVAACGGGGSSGTGEPSQDEVAGFIEDGPIAGARVFLVDEISEEPLFLCGKTGSEKCEMETGAAGSFSFATWRGTIPGGAFVVGIGGHDVETGLDLGDLEMRAPLKMFAGKESTITISPVTTLLSARLDSGSALEQAEEDVRLFLGLGTGKLLGARPSDDLELGKTSLFLTKVVEELKRSGETRPFARIAERISPSVSLVVGGELNGGVLGAMGLGLEAQKRVEDLFVALRDSSDPPAAAFRREEIAQGISETLTAMLSDSGNFDPDAPASRQNIDLLSDKILQAAGDDVIPLGGVVPQRLARYVLFTYNLVSPEIFLLDPTSFGNLLVREENGEAILLENDPKIGELAAIKAPYSVSVPLLAEELPGNDNQKRLEYYYNSDISHLYQAEKVIGSVFDDILGDSVMLEIVKGKAESGLLDDARSIIETQIFQTEAKGDGYWDLAQSFIRAGKFDVALTALRQAEDLYRKIIETEGEANISTADVMNLQWLAASYRKAGDLDASRAVLDYLSGLSVYFPTFASYGRLVTGTRDVADEYLDAGNLAEAEALVDSLLGFSQAVPPNVQSGKSFYSLRVYFLVETAKRYAILGNREKVAEIFNLIQALRANDGLQNLTEGETWPYMPDLVEVLYRVGETQEAFALADSIPATYENYLGITRSGEPYQKKAFKLVATFEALNSGLDNALAIIDEHFALDTDKIEALTYFALNKKGEYIALALIRSGQIATAEQALSLAADLVNSLTEITDRERYVNMIQLGYVKIADLYHEAGDDFHAAELLARAEEVAGGLTGVENLVNGLRDIALGYDELGNVGKVLSLLDLATGQTDAVAFNLTPGDSASLYDTLIQAYLKAHLSQAIFPALVNYVNRSREIFDPENSYAGTDHDTMAGYEVDNLVKAAGYYAGLGGKVEGLGLLAEAALDADQIFTASRAIAKYQEIIGGYTRLGDFDGALALADSLPYVADRNQAFHAIAQEFAQRDDFPDTWVASVDTDKDGKPDFFNPLAAASDIAASGLILDDDCDGDGIPDISDSRPLYKNQ